MLALLMVLAQPAEAVGPEVWAALNDGRLADAADRDSTQAIAIYEAILEHLPKDDPIHGELLYWLGRARYDAGDTEGARAVLENASLVDPSLQTMTRAFLQQIAMATSPVSTLPYQQTFDNETPGNGFSISFGKDVVQVDGFQFTLRALQRTTLQLELLDLDGSRWTARYSGLQEDSWTEFTLDMSDFSNAEGRNPDGHDLWQLTISSPDNIGDTATFEIASIGVF